MYEESFRKQVPFVNGDIRERAKLKRYLEWADVVIWLAALVGDPACTLDESLTIEINQNSIQYLKENFKGRIIFMSSCSVYGASDNTLDENSELQPLSLYAKTKVEAEKILNEENTLCYRLGTLYGISDCFSRIRFDLVVNTLIMHAIFHNKINVYGGEQFRPLLHVRDAANAIYLAIDKENTGIYNIHAENMKIINIAKRIKKYFPSLQIQTNEALFQDNRNYRVSSDKVKRELGFAPALTINDAIKEIKKLLEEGRIKNSFLSRFSNYLYLKSLIEEHSNPLGKEIKLNI